MYWESLPSCYYIGDDAKSKLKPFFLPYLMAWRVIRSINNSFTLQVLHADDVVSRTVSSFPEVRSTASQPDGVRLRRIVRVPDGRRRM